MFAIEIHGTLDMFYYFLLFNGCSQLNLYVECLWVILNWPSNNKVSVTYKADFRSQSSLFPCIPMAKVFWSNAKAIQQENLFIYGR